MKGQRNKGGLRMKKGLILFGLLAIIAVIPVFAYPLCHGGNHGCCPPSHHKMHRPSGYYGGAMFGRRWHMGNRTHFNSNIGYYNGFHRYHSGRSVFNSNVSIEF